MVGVLFLTLSVATPASSVFVIALAMAYYQFVLKRRGDWTVHVPV